MDERDALIEEAEDLNKKRLASTSVKDKYSLFKEVKKIKKKLSYINQIIRYLESGPTEEFLKKEQKRLEKEIEVIGGRFFVKFSNKTWPTLTAEKLARAEFEKEYGAKKKKEQLKNIKFILK